MMPPQPPPHIDASQLKPGRVWYTVAAAIMALGVCTGLGLGAFGVMSIIDDLPEMKSTFAADTETVVELSPDQEWAIFVDHPSDAGRLDAECAAEPVGEGTVDISTVSGNFTYSDSNHEWQLLFDVDVSEAGEYRFECTTDDGDVEFAVGDGVDMGGFFAATLGSVGALLVIPGIAVSVGIVIILVTLTRRSSHKKRLLHAHIAGGAPGPYGPYGPPPR